MFCFIILFIIFSNMLFPTISSANSICQNHYSVNLNLRDQKIKHVQRLAEILTQKLPVENLQTLQKQAEHHTKELETFFGEYPPHQRKKLVEDFIFNSVYPKFKVMYHSANRTENTSSNSSFAVEFNAIDFKIDSSMASVFQNAKLDVVDFVFFKTLEQPKYNNAIPLDSKDVHTLVIEQVDKDTSQGSYKKAQASIRILERTDSNMTAIERFARNNKIESSKLKDFFNRVEKKDATIFELSRVSNGTGNKNIMSALKDLISHFFLKNDKSKFLIISVSNPDLVSYYQRWGFEVFDELIDSASKKSFTIMVVSGDKFQTSTKPTQDN